MITKPSASAGHRAHAGNNLDFLRLVAALTVVWAHTFVISGTPAPALVAMTDPGTVAVFVFFTLSGYLIAASWNRDPDLWRFLSRRALRIYPALIAVVLLSALVVGPLLSTVPATEYFSDPRTWKYLRRALIPDGGGHLPGVFDTNPVPYWINAPLWTLKFELLMYGLFAAAAASGVWRALPFGTLTAACAFTAAWSLEKAGVLASYGLAFGLFESRHVAMFGAFFFAGAAWHDFGRAIRPRWSIGALLAGACLIANGTAFAPIVAALAAPYLVLGFGLARWPRASGIARYGDWSYGICIYGWPVHQTLVAASAGALGWTAQIVLVTLVTATLAALSWWQVERRAIALKPASVSRRGSVIAGSEPAVP